MQISKIRIGILAGLLALTTTVVEAGNPDRGGQAGGTQLLINPWARSSGWNGLNNASITGLEAERINVAGLARTKKTELLFSRTNYLSGSETFLNAFGLAQRIDSTSVFGVSVMSMDVGEIDITTTNQPDGGLGTFKPSYINIGISYAKEFSDRIYGGATIRIINESISDINSSGVAFDAGIQYLAGKNKQAKFGIALRNVGTPMQFAGDGLSFRGRPIGGSNTATFASRSERFELPSLMNIGVGYDFKTSEVTQITAVANFTSNSFSRDQVGVGAEFSWRKMVMLRAGYLYENGINTESTLTVYTGPSFGATFDIPFGDKGTRFGLDYSYRATNPFNGNHAIGVKITL